ncbi:hypothetical protein QFZ66_000374 [Streptomyces sp. B4I13]|uniref:SGNH/GDSL hydrolase family protein n=1 Tax=Streptomyces sp. B4I13 TaxID=3042271 RepID=UPI00278B72B0|nr:hypothetical protein [Streptomyces sp. B4I13]
MTALRTAPGTRRTHHGWTIGFIGDSLTVGYGNLSASRDCTGDQVRRTTDADVSHGALTARRLGADYRLNAYSGLGMVRNYNGGSPDVTYRTFYDHALLKVPGDVWQNPGTWRPRLVVANLGTSDFSTAVNPGEPWTPDSLAAAYRTAYSDFLQKPRTRYGAATTIVAVGAGSFAGSCRRPRRRRPCGRQWFAAPQERAGLAPCATVGS